ncbi:hypothetical protein BCR42DRAFT_429638 [Absidia repens]|uniref:Uncharacterized protein n=1 Tax=Absidia repens TaxID=90262 RepID=A0A1X2HRK7_9FUNG|nr:hypothetical protein BCR42DRAFT_429638 [Absidia repens]
MEFLVGLIKDWSTRVWVISEFNISKRKNNLKYWFTQLALNVNNTPRTYYNLKGGQDLTFFKFDFNNSSDTSMNVTHYENEFSTLMTRMNTTNPVYIHFHYTLGSQISRQTFLQNILISKASKNGSILQYFAILTISRQKTGGVPLENQHYAIRQIETLRNHAHKR